MTAIAYPLTNAEPSNTTRRAIYLLTGLIVANLLAWAWAFIEFGNNPHVREQAVSKRGKVFTRRRGNRFGPPAKTGHVAYPAARDAIPRIASLWVQTAVRTIHEQIEKVH